MWGTLLSSHSSAPKKSNCYLSSVPFHHCRCALHSVAPYAEVVKRIIAAKETATATGCCGATIGNYENGWERYSYILEYVHIFHRAKLYLQPASHLCIYNCYVSLCMYACMGFVHDRHCGKSHWQAKRSAKRCSQIITQHCDSWHDGKCRKKLCYHHHNSTI